MLRILRIVDSGQSALDGDEEGCCIVKIALAVLVRFQRAAFEL